jgi:hypothetical protein
MRGYDRRNYHERRSNPILHETLLCLGEAWAKDLHEIVDKFHEELASANLDAAITTLNTLESKAAAIRRILENSRED